MPVNRLKTTYQRNFLTGTLSAAVITLVACGMLYLDRDPVRTVEISTEKIIFTDIEFKAPGRGMAERGSDEDHAGVRHGFDLPDEAPMGAGRPDPLPDIGYKVKPPAMENPIIEASFTKGADRTPSPPNVGDPADDYYGYAVPDNHRSKYGGNAYPLKVDRPGNPNRPLWISGLHVKHPFNPTGLVDTVVVLLTTDEKGKITEIDIVYDALPGMGFAAQFKHALHAARIYPAWVDGQPVGGTYPVWCIFERSNARDQIKNSPNITISSSF